MLPPGVSGRFGRETNGERRRGEGDSNGRLGGEGRHANQLMMLVELGHIQSATLMKNITKFEIEGLFSDRNISIPIVDNKLVLVGPNGIGKSSVASIFYYFVSRQWGRLLAFDFETISITIEGERFVARRDDISGLSQFGKISASLPPSSRFRVNLEKLAAAGLAEQFMAPSKLELDVRRKISEVLEMPLQEVMLFQRSVWRRLSSDSDEDLFSRPSLSFEGRLAERLPGRVLYLPTYRRIEKDIKEIFPDFEARYRAYVGESGSLRAGRFSSHYIELVSFGMEDVRKNLADKMAELRNYSLSQYNNLSGVYLRDVIHGRADKFSSKDINDLTPKGIDDILERVSENALSRQDKVLLRDKIQSIQGKSKADIDTNDRYLAHYFTRLVSASLDIATREDDISSFVRVCNAYLSPSKGMSYDERQFEVEIAEGSGRTIDLSMLSSGEKQIVSIFAHLYLEDVRDQFVIIDEPELSLSVPWQKRFLTDIQESGRCGFLLAVTHSPFIYENSLTEHSIDLRRYTSVGR
jgi:ABC-type Mn2+/Zn2+ transport system ATPase subunit